MSFVTPKKGETNRKAKSSSAKRRLVFTETDEKQNNVLDVAGVATPEPTIAETPKKKARLDEKKEKIIVTPDKGEIVILDSDEEKEEYVPTYIHKNLSYHRRGAATLDEKTKKTFDLIKSHFTIPKDFEQNRKYGSLSGTCYEQRVIQAYTLSLLEPSRKENAGLEICSQCSEKGHKRVDCPTLI